MKKGLTFGIALIAIVFAFQVRIGAEDCCPTYSLRGDVNADGSINVGDVTCLTGYLFRDGCPGMCPQAADVNGDGSINVGDANYLIDYIFRGGPAPVLCG